MIQWSNKMYTLNEGIQKAVEVMQKSYIDMYEKNKSCSPEFADQQITKYLDTTRVDVGRNYTKVTADGSVRFFVVNKPTKGFKVGDVLKPASWRAPATNFARGNVCEGNYTITWVGVMY